MTVLLLFLFFFNVSLTEMLLSLNWMGPLTRARAITRTVSHQNIPQNRRYYLG